MKNRFFSFFCPDKQWIFLPKKMNEVIWMKKKTIYTTKTKTKHESSPFNKLSPMKEKVFLRPFSFIFIPLYWIFYIIMYRYIYLAEIKLQSNYRIIKWNIRLVHVNTVNNSWQINWRSHLMHSFKCTCILIQTKRPWFGCAG